MIPLPVYGTSCADRSVGRRNSSMATGIRNARKAFSDRDRAKTFMGEDSFWDCPGGRTRFLLVLPPKPDFRFRALLDVMRTGDLKSGWLESNQHFLWSPWLEREGLPTDEKKSGRD